MTKVIKLGEEKKDEKKPVMIEFVSFLDSDKQVSSSITRPNDWDFIELVCENYTNDGKDLMFAYDADNRDIGRLFFGYFNDGKV